MAKATLQNSAGQKVVVESGSPEAQKYFGQGYTLMQASSPASSASAVKPPASPASSVSSSAGSGYTSQDPAIQKQIADMQRQVQTLSSKASAYSAPSAPEAPKSMSTPAGQTQLQTSGNSQVPAGLTKIEGYSRGPSGVSSTNAYTQNPNFDEEYENQQWIGNDLYASKIPLATLISPTGQRVVARTDSVTGTKYKPASEYFSQGYVLESSPGVYKDPTTGKSTTFGAKEMEAAKPKQYEASKTQPVATSLSGFASGGSGGFSVPAGYTKISGALYPDRNSQLANFSDIQMYGSPGEPGSFLYGKPKNSSQPSDQGSGANGSGAPAPAQAPTKASAPLPLDILSFLSQNVVSPDAAAQAFGYGGNSQAEKAAALEKLYAESSKAIIDRQSQLKALEDEILKSMAISPEEEAAQKALDELSAQQRNISSSEELGINEIKKQPIAMSFLSGQTAAVQRDAASKINALASQSEPLKAQLIAAQAKRAASSDIAKTKYDIAQKQYQQFLDQTKPMEVGGNIVRFNPITQKFETVYEGPSEASKPVSVAPGATLVDPLTGKVIYQAPSASPTLSPQAILQRASDIKAQRWAEGNVNFTDAQAIQQATAEFMSVAGMGQPQGGQTQGSGSVPNFVTAGPASGVASGQGGMRTDRSNNPTAMIVDIVRQAGLKEGVDYVVGDPFTSGSKTFYTAKLLGDPVAQTIKIIDKVGFQTASGSPRWSYIDMPKQQWDSMSQQQKAQVIHQMYQREGNQGALEPYFQKYGVSSPSQAGQASQPAQQSQPFQASQNTSWQTGNAAVDSWVEKVYKRQANLKDVPDSLRAPVSSILAKLPTVGNAMFSDMSQQDRDAVNDILNTLPDIDNLARLTSDMNTGPYADAWRSAMEWAGLPTDANRVDARAISEKLRAFFGRRISGATVSDKEVARLSKFLPLLNQQDANFDANLRLLKEGYTTSLDNIAKMYGFQSADDFIKAFQGQIQMPGSQASSGVDIQSLRAQYSY